MYFNINAVNFLKDLQSMFPLGELKHDTVFFVDENDKDVVTVTDPKNAKEQKYLRLYLHEGDDVPEKGFRHDVEEGHCFITHDIFDRFAGQGFPGNSQSFLSQGMVVYISENYLKHLKQKSGEENGFDQYIPTIHPIHPSPLMTLDDIVHYVHQVKSEIVMATLCSIALHVDQYMDDDTTLHCYDYYLDIFDLLVKSGLTRTKANDVIQFILEQPESLKAILASHGMMVWGKTVFIKSTIQTNSGRQLPPAMLFDVYEPRKVLQDIMLQHENFNLNQHGEFTNVHVFTFANPVVYTNPATREPFGPIQLFTTNPRFHQTKLYDRIEEVLKAIDAESGLQGKPQSCYAYFKAMEKETQDAGKEIVLAPNNVNYNVYIDGYDIAVNNDDQIYHIGHGLYMSVVNNK